MSYLVMARKYRPLNFDEVVGQPHVVLTLKNALKNGRYAHAYIFSGPRGVGKTSTARILAKALNCVKGPTPDPCGKCHTCSQITSGTSLDVLEIDAASNRGIDEIRNLRENVRFAPAEGKFRVYIIDEIHMLTKEANNAFLKTLEEPPSHSIFIGATTEIEQIPRTVLSRVQRFNFRLVPQGEIAGYLKFISEKENIAVTEEAIDLLAGRANGSLRDGVGLLDQLAAYCEGEVTADEVRKALGVIDQNLYFRATEAVTGKDSAEIFRLVEDLSGTGADPAEFMRSYARFFRDLLFIKSSGGTDLVEGVEAHRQRMKAYSESFSELDLVRLMKIGYEGANELKRSQTPMLGLELRLFTMMKLHDADELSRVLEGWDTGSRTTAEQKTVKKPDLFETGKETKKASGASPAVDEEPPSSETTAISEEPDSAPEMELQDEDGEGFEAAELDGLSGLERVRAMWSKVAEALKAHNHLSNCLRDAVPVAIKQSYLEIACGGDLQMKRLKEKKLLVQEAIKEVTGMSLALKCYKDDSIAKTARKLDAERSGSQRLQETLEDDSNLKELFNRFEAEET